MYVKFWDKIWYWNLHNPLTMLPTAKTPQLEFPFLGALHEKGPC